MALLGLPFYEALGEGPIANTMPYRPIKYLLFSLALLRPISMVRPDLAIQISQK